MIVTKKRILHAIRQGKVGGGETHVLDLVNALDKNLYESIILSFTEGPMVDKLKSDGFQTFVINTEKPFNVTVWNTVKKLITEQKIDLIHAHGTRANSNTFFSARTLQIPLIYTVHGWSFHPDQKPIVKFIRTFSERFLVNIANKTICVSQSNLNEGKSKFSMKNAVVIANGINRDKFNPEKNFEDIRVEFDIPDNVVLVGYIARITHQKSPLAFLHAINAIDYKENLKFLIVGDGDLKPAMLSLARELDLEKHIIFVDFRNDIPDILNAIDIFCLPSLWEGLPIALLEAMSMRKTIIASSIDGITDLIVHNENGILVNPNNINSIADAISLLRDNESLRKQLGLAAEDTVKEKFNIELMTGKIERIYQEF